MPDPQASTDGFARFAWRTTAAHTATYMIAGIAASALFDYPSRWEGEWMAHYRPLDSPLIAMGPSLQVIRGLIFAIVLYPFRTTILSSDRGWLKLWGVLAGVGILSTYAAAPGSVEGLIYTLPPLSHHLFGIPEVYGQSLAFSLALVGWYRRPHRAWDLVFGALLGLVLLFGLAGVFLAPLADA